MNTPSPLATTSQRLDRPARPARPTVSCVVPAYNEAGNLPALLQVLTARLHDCASAWEVLVVDDGSRDMTEAALLPWLQEPGVRLLRLSRNFGKEVALSAGIDHALGEVVVLLDADLQHPPELIPQMIDAWAAGADMVCAARASRDDESWRKRLGTRWFYAIVNASSRVEIPEDAGDFRLMDRKVVDALKSLPERDRFLKGLYAWVGFRNQIVRYTPDARLSGESSFSLRGLASLALTGITSFTNLPLRVWSGVGAVVAFAAMLLALYVVAEHFVIGNPVPGWATIVVSVSFFSGMQLLSIGILGEYVGRIYNEVKQRPLYLIGQETGRSGIAPPANPSR